MERSRFVIEFDKPLGSLNTFGFDQSAERYAEARDESALTSLLEQARRARWPVLLMGGGSNIVLTEDVPGLVLRLTERHVERSPGTSPGSTLVTASAGVGWHDLVMRTVADGVRGLENLALIPGSVGAAPVQNVGAYGVELADRMHSLRAWHRPSHRFRSLTAAECEFGYRDSLFKRERDDWIITRVTFELGPHHPVVADYGTLSDRLAERGISTPVAADIAAAVVDVRRERLPDPEITGNAGSFFHNPVVTAERALALTSRFPGLVTHRLPDGRVKLGAGWLIDRLGYRGYRENGVGVHDRQALVLVNHGGTGHALLSLARKIARDVERRYGVTLVMEPRIV